MRKINLILSDLDGTILSKGYKLSQESLIALYNLQRKDYYLIPVTARNHYETYLFCLINNTCITQDKEIWGVIELGGGLILPSFYQGLPESLIKTENYVVRPLSMYIHNFYRYIESLLKMKCNYSFSLIPAQSLMKTAKSLQSYNYEYILMYPRYFDLLVDAPEECILLIEKSLKNHGFSVIKGARLLHIGYSLSKKRGVEELIKAMASSDYVINDTICIGDSIVDLEFIRLCNKKFVVNMDIRDDNIVNLRLSPEQVLVKLLDYVS